MESQDISAVCTAWGAETRTVVTCYKLPPLHGERERRASTPPRLACRNLLAGVDPVKHDAQLMSPGDATFATSSNFV